MRNKKIYYGKAVYDSKEINAVLRVLKNNSLNLIDGPHVKRLEKEICKIFGKKYALMVNSGSSANLLGLSALNFKKGSEIITPNLTFSTTIAPIYQLGLIPHFIGVESKGNLKLLRNRISKDIELGVIHNWPSLVDKSYYKNKKTVTPTSNVKTNNL